MSIKISALPTPGAPAFPGISYSKYTAVPVSTQTSNIPAEQSYQVQFGDIVNVPPKVQTINLTGSGTTVIDPRKGRVVQFITHGAGAKEIVKVTSPNPVNPSPYWGGMNMCLSIETLSHAGDQVAIYAGGSYGDSGYTRIVNPKFAHANANYTDTYGVILAAKNDIAVFKWGTYGGGLNSWVWDASASAIVVNHTNYVTAPITITQLKESSVPAVDPYTAGSLFRSGDGQIQRGLNISTGARARPAGASFTWLNQSGASFTDNLGGPLVLTQLTTISGSSSINGLYKAVAGLDWTVTAKITQQAAVAGSNIDMAGLLLYDGANKLYSFGWITGNQLAVWHYSNPTTFVASDATVNFLFQNPVWLRAKYVHGTTTLSFSVSADGYTFVPVFSTAAPYFTPADYGINVGEQGNSAGRYLSLFEFVESTP